MTPDSEPTSPIPANPISSPASEPVGASAHMPAPSDTLAISFPRFTVELVAWVATPWALAPHSVVLAVLADIILIGLPTVFGVPRSRKQSVPVAVPGPVGIALERLQAAAAVTAAYFAWPFLPTLLVVGALLVAGMTQRRRWTWMFSHVR